MKLINAGYKPLLKSDDIKNNELFEKHKKNLIENFTLRFKPKDVKYIIVRDDNEILELAKIIENSITVNLTNDEKILLVTCLISIKKIKEDF